MRNLLLALGAALLLAAACGSEPEPTAAEFDAGETLEFGDTELYFLQLDGGHSVWRFDPATRDTNAITPLGGMADDVIIAIEPGRAGGLFGLVTRNGQQLVAVIGNDSIEPVFSGEMLNCISGGVDVDVSVLQAAAPASAVSGQTSQVLEIDKAVGLVAEQAFVGPHVFCPRWSADGTRLAYAVPASGGLTVVVDGRVSTRAISGCDLAPGDFSRDGLELAVSALCEPGSELDAGLYVFSVGDLDAEPLPLRSGLTGVARWSPDGEWVAYTWAGPDLLDVSSPDSVIEVMNVESREYVTVPFLNSSFPAWVGNGNDELLRSVS